MAKLGLILGDQLSTQLPTLTSLDRDADRLVLAEVGAEARYVKHHKQKIALLFSAMRHFAQDLRDAGWQLDYHEYDPEQPDLTLLDVLGEQIKAHDVTAVVVTHCGEYRLHHDMQSNWQRRLGVPLQMLEDSRFVCTPDEFDAWAEGRKQLRMEYFYREMRQKTGLLMDGDEPFGGQWNFDADNRKAYKGEPPVPQALEFRRDDIDRDVLALVARHFDDHPGSLEDFRWATRRSQAERALAHFIDERLPHFGDYQDAMNLGEDALFHSLLSPYLNCGLLDPLDVCRAAEKAWQDDKAPLNAVEGFIRQIIGWREYVRGIYWRLMPGYARENKLGNSRSLPRYYWDGETDMQCMREAFRNTFEHAYAHHIQRLMITGNFALLTDIQPEAICEWYLAVYADAYDWVELPNTLGMVMHADGGYLGSKPYAASGNYIHKMSDYCKHCTYNVKSRTEHDSCPFNALYWDFIARHRDAFADNHRMGMIYRSYDRMSDADHRAIGQRAAWLLEHLDDL